MDEVTLVKTLFRKEQWKKLIFECQSSGMQVKDWCALDIMSLNRRIITGFEKYVKKLVKICR